MKIKKYAKGGLGTNTPMVNKGVTVSDPETAAKGKITNAEYLERLTWENALQELKKSGVGTIGQDSTQATRVDGGGNKALLHNDYNSTIALAKKMGVYDTARQRAVAKLREKK
jgi:homoserine acetyltransferase